MYFKMMVLEDYLELGEILPDLGVSPRVHFLYHFLSKNIHSFSRNFGRNYYPSELRCKPSDWTDSRDLPVLSIIPKITQLVLTDTRLKLCLRVGSYEFVIRLHNL